MGQLGVPCQVQLGGGGTLPGVSCWGYPARGVSCWGVPCQGGTLLGGYPARGYPAGGVGYPAGGVPCWGVPCQGVQVCVPCQGCTLPGYPPSQVRKGGTQLGQQKEYSLHGRRYASCVNAGGLSCNYCFWSCKHV